jgi:hypothetical protein
VSRLVNEARLKKRSMTRRANVPGEDIVAKVDDVEESLVKLHKLIRMAMMSAFSGDEALELMRYCECRKSQFGKGLTSRVAKMVCHDDLKFCRWDALASTTYSLVVECVIPKRSADLFYGMQLAQLLQRLLRGVSIGKVTL